jgi:hypothetical protein
MYSEGIFHDIYSKYSCLMSMLSFCLLMSENGSDIIPLSHYLCDASVLIILHPHPPPPANKFRQSFDRLHIGKKDLDRGGNGGSHHRCVT